MADDAIKIKLTAKPDPKAYQTVQRDTVLVGEDGRMVIVKAGTKLPVHNYEAVEVKPDLPKSDET